MSSADLTSAAAAAEPSSLWFFSLALDYADGAAPARELPFEDAMGETRRVFDAAVPAALAEAGMGGEPQGRLFYGRGLHRGGKSVVPVANLHVRTTPAGAARLADALLSSLRLREVVYYRRASIK